jgi:hypothetical protein
VNDSEITQALLELKEAGVIVYQGYQHSSERGCDGRMTCGCPNPYWKVNSAYTEGL